MVASIINKFRKSNLLAYLLMLSLLIVSATGCGGGTQGSNPPVNYLFVELVDESGTPLSDTSLELLETGATKTTNENGRAEFQLDIFDVSEVNIKIDQKIIAIPVLSENSTDNAVAVTIELDTTIELIAVTFGNDKDLKKSKTTTTKDPLLSDNTKNENDALLKDEKSKQKNTKNRGNNDDDGNKAKAAFQDIAFSALFQETVIDESTITIKTSSEVIILEYQVDTIMAGGEISTVLNIIARFKSNETNHTTLQLQFTNDTGTTQSITTRFKDIEADYTRFIKSAFDKHGKEIAIARKRHLGRISLNTIDGFKEAKRESDEPNNRNDQTKEREQSEETKKREEEIKNPKENSKNKTHEDKKDRKEPRINR